MAMIEIRKTMAIMAMVGGGGRWEGSSFAGNQRFVEQLGGLQAAGDDDNGDDGDEMMVPLLGNLSYTRPLLLKPCNPLSCYVKHKDLMYDHHQVTFLSRYSYICSNISFKNPICFVVSLLVMVGDDCNG